MTSALPLYVRPPMEVSFVKWDGTNLAEVATALRAQAYQRVDDGTPLLLFRHTMGIDAQELPDAPAWVALNPGDNPEITKRLITALDDNGAPSGWLTYQSVYKTDPVLDVPIEPTP